MTETTLAVDVNDAGEHVPSECPLAEEALAAHPAMREIYADRAALAALEAPPDVVVGSGIRSEFDRLVESYAPSLDGPVHAQVDSWWQEACAMVTAIGRPGLAFWRPALKAVDSLPGEEVRQAHQEASVADLRRWAPDKTFAAEPDDTKFLDAFSEDPEGDSDRAPLPPEIHHETGEIR